MLRLQEILCTPPAEQARGVSDQHFLLVLGWLALAQHKNASSETGAVEKIGCQPDHGLDQVHLQQLLADAALHTFVAKQRTLGQHHGHPAAHIGHRLDHVLHPGEVTA
ncbi:hypothetical protein FQZ97_636320 [compost metagenome]